MKDIRLKQRLITLVEQLSQKPTASVPLACGNWPQTKASYRFWDNKKVEIDEIITAQKLSTWERTKDEEIILAIQDTTDLDFTSHPNPTGLGHLDAKYLRGLKVHSVLAVSTSGVPLGILALTTLAVESVAEAMTCIRYYTLRWLIERYHYTLKSGCQLEQLQLETADRIKRAFVTYSLVAWRLLWLTYQSRLEPDTSCECILEPDEWQALACHHLGQGQPPPEPPTLGEAVLMLAQLGGFLARRGDGVPGVKTIWRGFSRLTDLVTMWRLLHQPPHPT